MEYKTTTFSSPKNTSWDTLKDDCFLQSHSYEFERSNIHSIINFACSLVLFNLVSVQKNENCSKFGNQIILLRYFHIFLAFQKVYIFVESA